MATQQESYISQDQVHSIILSTRNLTVSKDVIKMSLTVGNGRESDMDQELFTQYSITVSADGMVGGRPSRFTQTDGCLFCDERGDIYMSQNWNHLKVVINSKAMDTLIKNNFAVENVEDTVVGCLLRLSWNGEEIHRKALTAFKLKLQKDMMPNLVKEIMDIFTSCEKLQNIRSLVEALIGKYHVKWLGIDTGSLVFIFEHKSAEDCRKTVEGPESKERQRQIIDVLLTYILPAWVAGSYQWEVSRYLLSEKDFYTPLYQDTNMDKRAMSESPNPAATPEEQGRGNVERTEHVQRRIGHLHIFDVQYDAVQRAIDLSKGMENWAQTYKLAEQTLAVLAEDGFNALEEIRLLTLDDVDKFYTVTGRLQKAQCLRLRTAVEALNNATTQGQAANAGNTCIQGDPGRTFNQSEGVDHWAQTRKLTTETLEKLRDDGFDSLEEVSLLTPDDVDKMYTDKDRLPMAQCLRLKRAVEELNNSSTQGEAVDAKSTGRHGAPGRKFQDSEKIDQWAKAHTLTPQTLTILLEDGFDSLKALSQLKPGDVDEYYVKGRLNKVQSVTLKTAVEALNNASTQGQTANVRNTGSHGDPKRKFQYPEATVPPLYKTHNETLQKERLTFQEKLKDFPHLFQLKGYSELTTERQQDILDRLQSDRADCNSYRTPVEDTCMANFIAFLFFLKNDVYNALEETRNILNSPNTETNIVALANMAVMLWETGKRVEGEKCVKKLEELRGKENFKDKVLDGKAEMAYCYSRMGMGFALLAVDVFEEMVQQRPCDYTWKFGLALVLRRFTHANFRIYYRMSSESTCQRSLRAFDILLEIKNSDAPNGNRAQALAELAMLVDQSWNPELSEVIKRAKEKGVTAEQCFAEALKLAPQDVSVLTKAGKFFKNKNNLNRSRELFERAISIRPTTTAHHYLGMTFLKMAKFELKNQSRRLSECPARARRFHSDQGAHGRSCQGRGYVENRGNSIPRGQRRRSQEKDERLRYYKGEALTKKVEHSRETTFGMNKPSAGDVSAHLSTALSAMTVSEEYNQADSSQRRTALASVDYRRIMKSPAKLALLKADDKYVSDALHHLNQAIEVSHMENSPAIYDLGLLYVSLGDDDKALDLFTTLIKQKESRSSPLQIINAYEQSGLIYIRKNDSSSVEEDRQNHAAEGRRLLRDALQMQCQLVSSLSTCLPDHKDIWPSFHILCSTVRGTESPDQRKELAQLFEMVKNYTGCLKVLDEMARFSQEEACNPEILEIKLKCYVSSEQYDDALLFLSLLETTEQAKQMSEWSDPEVPRKVRVMAAKQKLLNVAAAPHGSTEEKTAKACFLQAFQANGYHSDEQTQRKYVKNVWSEDPDRKGWHVMILYDLQDDDMKVKGLALKAILQDVCGLRVTCMSDEIDVKPGQHEMWTILENVEKSQTVVVMCGLNDFSEEFCTFFLQPLPEIRACADNTCQAVLALLLDNAQCPKDLLHPDRCLQCPPALVKPTESYTQPELINDLCSLFCFLADVSIDVE